MWLLQGIQSTILFGMIGLIAACDIKCIKREIYIGNIFEKTLLKLIDIWFNLEALI